MKNAPFDKDLTALFKECDNEDLDPIVNIILSATSQTLTVQKEYKEHTGDHKTYVDAIVYEINSFGGNSLANLVRGHGVPYAEMVRDVAGKLGVKTGPTDTIASLEMKIILRILKLSYEQLGEDDQLALRELLDLGDELDFSEGFPEDEIGSRLGTAGQSLIGDRIQNAIRTAARSAQIRQTLVGLVKSGITKIATAGLGGPVSWTLAIGQTIYDLFGPSYTIALGLVAQIGLLRQKHAQVLRDADIPEEMEM